MKSYMKFGPVVLEVMSFKDISYLELWQHLCSVDWIHLCNIGRRHHEERTCVINLDLDHWFRRKCCLNVFLIWSFGSPLVQRSLTICAILVEGIERNDSVKFIYFNMGQWFRRRRLLKDFLSGALATLLFSGAELFMQFWKRTSLGTSYKVI